jgi:Rieske Fe-S protein
MAEMEKSDKSEKTKAKAADQAISAGRTENAENPPAAPTNRRRVLEWTSFILGSLIALLPFSAGFWTFLDPWLHAREPPKSRRRGGTGGKEGFVRVTTLDALQVGGAPQRFPVIADKIDGWNFLADQAVGSVFLHRTADKQVRCFNATCPHAGCSVSCVGQAYVCPCHNSSFNLDGTKLDSQSGRENPSPRNLDDLVVDEQKLNDNEVWVQFMNFYTGKHEKTPKE